MKNNPHTPSPISSPQFFTSPPIIIIYIILSLSINSCSSINNYLLFYFFLILLCLYYTVSVYFYASLSILIPTYQSYSILGLYLTTLILMYLWVDRKGKENIQRWLDGCELCNTTKWQHNTGYRTQCLHCKSYRRQIIRHDDFLKHFLMVYIGKAKVKLENFFLELLSWCLSGNSPMVQTISSPGGMVPWD